MQKLTELQTSKIKYKPKRHKKKNQIEKLQKFRHKITNEIGTNPH